MFQMITKIMNIVWKTEKAVILAIMRRIKNHATVSAKKNVPAPAKIAIAKQNAQKIAVGN